MFKTSNYVSEIDCFLKSFDDQHPIKSPSQQTEIEKHKKIAHARQHRVKASLVSSTLWEAF